MSYTIDDWRSGIAPPKGWDCADACDDDWSNDELTEFMRATVQTWTPPTDPKPEARKEPKDEVAKKTEAGPSAATKGPVARIVPDGADGIDNLPHVFGSVAFGSEVYLAKVFVEHLRDACGGPIVKADGKFWAWGPTAWRELPEQRLRLAVHAFDAVGTGPKETPLKLGRRMIDGILHEAGTKVADADFFAAPRVGINARNGFITIEKDGKINVRPHEPDDRSRFTIDTDFELHTDMHPPEGTMLHKLITDAFLDDPDAEDKRKLVGEVLGAAVLGMATRVRQPKAFVFLGETANNSKSTVAGLISRLLPAGSVSAISPASFGDERRIVNLAGKAANVADELSAGAIAGEVFKAAITGDPIEGRDVFKAALSFRPTALHCYTTNVLPRFNGGIDRGLRRRLVVLQFNRSIPEDEVIEDIGDRIQRDELDLLLGFAIAGAQRLMRQGGYTVPASSKTALQEWLLLDPVNEWFDIRIVAAKEEPSGGWWRTGKLYEDFKQWAIDNGYSAQFLPPVNTFSQRLKAMPNIELKRRAEGMVAMGVKINGGRDGQYDVQF